MQLVRNLLFCCLLSLLTSGAVKAQSTASSSTTVVPQLVNFSGTAINEQGTPFIGIVGITFSIYNAQEGGAPLWIETQNVQANGNGNYTVQLGATTSQGLPLGLFASGEARWLGVSINGGEEQPRVLLLSVPYALKAADAQTLAGLPASAFVLAAPSGSSGSAPTAPANPGTPESPALSGTGTTDFIPLWTNSTTLGDSVLFQSGTGSTAKVGINNTTPLTTLDVKGSATVRGYLETPAIANATASTGSNSNPMVLVASSFNSSTSKAVTQNFVWQAEPVGNDTTTPSGTLNLLFGAGTATPAETGLHVASNGQINFATGQTFPGTGTISGITTATGSGLTGGGTSGTLNLALTNSCAANQVLQWNGSAWGCTTISGGGSITGVIAGTDLTGGGTSGNVTLNVDTTKVPQLNAANTFTGNQTVNGTMTATTFSGNGSGLTNVTAANANELGGLAPSAFAQLGASSNTFTGSLTASSFTGNGSGLSDVNAADLNGLSSSAFSQTVASNTYQSSPLGTAIPQVVAPINNATTSSGFNSNPLDLAASSYNSTASAAQSQTFQWQAEPTGNNTGSPSGTLNLLFGANGAPPTETGLNVASNGQVTFASGQTFPGVGTITGVTTASGSGLSGGGTSGSLNLSLTNTCTANQVLQWTGSAWACSSSVGNGTITGVTAGTDLTGGGSSGNVTLNVDTTQVPQLNAANTFTGNQTVAGTLFASSQVAGSSGYGVIGADLNGTGVAGDGLTGVSGNGATGVFGYGTNYGVYGSAVPGDDPGYGVFGTGDGAGVAGYGEGSADGVYGWGQTGVQALGAIGVYAQGDYSTGGPFIGVYGTSAGGAAVDAYGTDGATGILAGSDTGFAGYFNGNVQVEGGFSVSGHKEFKIDHPVDPANKYLVHSSVESSEMMNIYTGNVMTDAHGEATVRLPEWFEALNTDFRYQLTVVGQFAQAIVSHEIEHQEFQIKTNIPNVKVSWLVTGVRQDAYAKAYPMQVEEDKPEIERGFYLHPELYGAPEEKGILWATAPKFMEQWKQSRTHRKIPPAPPARTFHVPPFPQYQPPSPVPHGKQPRPTQTGVLPPAARNEVR